MLTTDLISLLSCPTCQSDRLEPKIEKQTDEVIDEGNLTCGKCGESYPVHSGVPNLVPRDVLGTEEWQMWRDHLDGLQARREQRKEKSDKLVNRLSKHSRAHKAFSEFVKIDEGAILDVGCGPGNVRFLF